MGMQDKEVSAMEVSEYIETVTSQMRCKRARAMVAKELADHISDQTESYIKEGMEAESVGLEAVRQMGDAVEVGMEMDRIHRPRLDKRVLGIVLLFSLVSVFLQTMLVQGLDRDGMSARMVPLHVLLGVIVMVGILYADYTILGKHPLILWIFVMVMPFAVMHGGRFWLHSRILMYMLLGLMLPAYVGLIYYYRKKGWKGVLCCVVWLFVAAFLYQRAMHRFSNVCMIGLACMVLLFLAVLKGWFEIPKGKAVATLAGSLLGCVGVFFGYISQYPYRINRIYYFLHYAEDPSEEGYIPARMKEGLADLSALTPAGEWLHTWEYPSREPALSFYTILKELGVFPTLLLVAGLTALFVCMVIGVARQKNVLGSLLGMACVMGLAIPAACHILTNLTLLPLTDIYMPFLYPGLVVNIVSYTLLGMYLSVYRYTDVVA